MYSFTSNNVSIAFVETVLFTLIMCNTLIIIYFNADACELGTK